MLVTVEVRTMVEVGDSEPAVTVLPGVEPAAEPDTLDDGTPEFEAGTGALADGPAPYGDDPDADGDETDEPDGVIAEPEAFGAVAPCGDASEPLGAELDAEVEAEAEGA